MIPRHRNAGRPGIDGASLIPALLVLAAMALGAAALVQSVDASVQLARHASFQRDAVNRNEVAIRQAMKEFRDTTTARFAKLAKTEFHASASGIVLPYRATAPDSDPNLTDTCPEGIDRSGVPWAMRTSALSPADPYSAFRSCFGDAVLTAIRVGPAEGMETVWMVERLCDREGSFDSAHCATVTPRSGDTCSRCQTLSPPLAPAFRVTARTMGPRNTDVVSQAIFSLPLE